MNLKQLCDREYRRSQQMTIKTEAIWITFLELDGILNLSKFAKKYFGNRMPGSLKNYMGLMSAIKKERLLKRNVLN